MKLFEFFKANSAGMESAAAALKIADFERAIRLYGDVIRADRANFEAYYKRGNAQYSLGRWEEALDDYDCAIGLNAAYAHAWCNRGAVLERLDRRPEALDSYDRAIAINPHDSLAFYNRGSVLKDLRQFSEALISYDRAIALKSDYVEAHINRGYLLQEMKQHEAAIAGFDRAIEIDPSFAAAFQSRGFSLAQLRRFEEALASYDRAIELRPEYAEAFQGRLYSLVSLGRFEAAIAAYDQALALNPDQKYLAGLRLHAKLQICDWNRLASELAQLTERTMAGFPASPPFPLLAAIDSPALHRKAAELWVSDQCPADSGLGEIPRRSRRPRICIGYFSPDFRSHAVSLATAQLFESHDRSRFEISGFAFGPRVQDPVRDRLQRGFDRFLDVTDQSDAEVAALARTLGIDIAVDLGGYTEFCRAKIFALRAAPIQVNYLGYPGTMGAKYVDYMIGDATVVPPEQRVHYLEKILFLPNSYIPHDSTTAIADHIYSRVEVGLPPKGFVFCCFNKKYKIMPAVFDLWMRILGRVTNSVLWLSRDNEAAAERLRLEARQRGIACERLVFADRTESLPHHLARLRCADLFLDTLPYNAHATATDALWAGLPMITLLGQSFAARVSASLLHSIGLPELVAVTSGQYEDLAVRLATDAAFMRLTQQKLTRNRATTPLFDSNSFTKHLEKGYEIIWGRHLAGLPPEDVAV